MAVDSKRLWKAEKATLQGATRIKEQIEAAKLELEAAQRKQDFLDNPFASEQDLDSRVVINIDEYLQNQRQAM